MTPTVDKPEKPRRKLALHWRIARHTGGTILLLVVLAIGGALLFLRNLDTGFIKTRLRNLAREEAGLDLDYDSAQVDVFSGIVLKNFTIAQPPEVRPLSPLLMQAGLIRLGWSLFGKGPMLRHFVANDVTLTVIIDDDGATSLDTLGKKSGKKKEAEKPPSPGQQLLSLLRSFPEFDRVQFSPLTVEVLQSRAGKVYMRTELSGLDLRAASNGLDDDRTVELSLGEDKHPLPIALSHDDGTRPLPETPKQLAREEAEEKARAKDKDKKHPLAKKKSTQPLVPEATATLFLDGKLGAKEASLRAEIDLTQQTLDKEWPQKGVLFAIDAKARSDGDALAVQLDRFEAVAEAIVAKGALLVAPGRARIDAAKGTVDLTRLARLVPAARLPFALREGQTKYDVAGLDLDPTPKLDPGGHLDVDIRASGLRVGGAECETHEPEPRKKARSVEKTGEPEKVARETERPPVPGCATLGKVELNLDGVHLTLRGRPLKEGGVQLNLSLPAEAMTLVAARTGVKVALTHATTDVDATLPTGAPGHIEIRTRFDTLGSGGHIGRLDAQGGSIESKLSDIVFNAKEPGRSSAAEATTLTLASLTTQARGVTTRSNDLKIALRARAVDGEPSGVELDSNIGRFTAQNAHEVLVPAGPAQLSTRIEHIKLDRKVPMESLADVTLHSAIGQISVAAKIAKLRDGATFDLAVDAERAALLTAFAPPSLELPGKMAFALKTKGRLDGFFAPRIKQAGSLHVANGAVTLSDSTLSATTLDVAIESDGNGRRQDLAVTIVPRGLALDDETLGDGALTLKAKWDASRPACELTVDGTGPALPDGHLAANFEWEHATKALVYKIDGALANLEALSPLLPASLTDEHWIDLSDLKAKIASHGQITGVITGFDRRGAPTFSKNPLATLRGDDELSLGLSGFHYVDARSVELTIPTVQLTTKIRSDGNRHHGEAELRVDSAALVAQKHKINVAGMIDNFSVELDGDPRTGPIEVTHKLNVKSLHQDLIPLYAIGDLAQVTHGRRTADGTLQLDHFEVDNAAGGTHLTAHGGLTLARAIVKRTNVSFAEAVGFSSLGLTVAVTQQLDKLNNDPGRFIGGGSVGLEADLMSGDLRRYHVTATTRFHNANVTLPTADLKLVNLDGALPIIEDFVIEPHKAPRLFHAQVGNAYPQLRFSDQHPFLSGSGALSIEKISVGDLDITDLAGNVRIVRDQLAIDQLDAGMRGGRIAGQCLIDWRGPDSTAQLRVRMTGIEARHKGARERFDGNAALNLQLRERDLDGRIEILRIGRQHLYDLLDEADAHHKDAAINRVRAALELGYPDRVQVVFDRGFASMQVAFGGLARLVKIHEVHGIPVGPLVERYLGPVLSLEGQP